MSIPVSQFIPPPLSPLGVYMFVLYVCASISALKIIFLKIYLFLAVLGLHCCEGFSLAVASRGCSLVAVGRLLIVVASPVAGQGLRALGLQQL